MSRPEDQNLLIVQSEYTLSDAKTKIPSKWISKTQHVRKKCDYITALFPQFSSPACLWNEILLSASTESFPVEF